jgi:TolB-like protein
MTDIFLSYSREDQATARRFAEAFEREGLSVWWDQTLKPGEAYDRVTEKALQDAKAVVVLWSRKSVESHWVRSEATQAQTNGTLVPVMIEPCKRPIMFELMHTAELAHWKGDPNDGAWRTFLGDVPQFVKKEGPVASPSATPPASNLSRQFGTRVLIGVVALLLIGPAAFWLARAQRSAQVGAGSATTTKEVTLAVLPFRNISSDPAQESFANGLSEELLNQLTQIRELRVTGRTSSFSFKNNDEDPRVIAEKLGVASLLEGTIRRDDKRLRVTAKLINGKDGTNLWTRSYDHVLTVSGIIAIQEEIAKDVAQALSIRLDIGDMSRVKGGTTNWDAYEKYLHATSAFGRGDFLQGAQDSRDAVALDPTFARAWYGLYRSLGQVLTLGMADSAATRKEMAETGARVVALAPDAPWTQTVRMSQFVEQHRWSEAEAAIGATRQKSAPTPEFAFSYGVFLAEVGRTNEALEYFQRAVQRDPLSRAVSGTQQMVLYSAGRTEESASEYERYRGLAGNPGVADIIALYRLWSAKDVDTEAVKAQVSNALPRGAGIFGITRDNWNDKPTARAQVRKAFEDPANRNVIFFSIADHYGERDMALAALRRELIELHGPPFLTLWLPSESGVRTDPRFKDIVRELGLVDYWRTTGKWGDFCKPVGTGDFECH